MTVVPLNERSPRVSNTTCSSLKIVWVTFYVYDEITIALYHDTTCLRLYQLCALLALPSVRSMSSSANDWHVYPRCNRQLQTYHRLDQQLPVEMRETQCVQIQSLPLQDCATHAMQGLSHFLFPSKYRVLATAVLY